MSKARNYILRTGRLKASGPAKKNKYNAKKIFRQGRWWYSTGEYYRACELQILERVGEISDLKYQVKYELSRARVKGKIDFAYIENGERIMEDFKGCRTERFKIIVVLWKVYGPCPLRVTKKKGKSYGYLDEEIIPQK